MHPDAMRLHGIKGIDKVHLTCDQLSTNDFFWTVDGDNYLVDSLVYNEKIDTPLLLFHAIDPIDKMPTLLGGVKLWKKGSIINPSMNKGDFCLNATASKKVIDKSYSITTYNASPFDAWKTSFRHCVKLMSVIFKSRPGAKNINRYLDHWKSCNESTEANANWCYLGYKDAEAYVQTYDNNLTELFKINDYAWLTSHFNKLHE